MKKKINLKIGNLLIPPKTIDISKSHIFHNLKSYKRCFGSQMLNYKPIDLELFLITKILNGLVYELYSPILGKKFLIERSKLHQYIIHLGYTIQ